MKRRHLLKLTVFVVCAAAVLGGVENRMADAEAKSGPTSKPVGRSVFAALAGEFRATIANLLWIKVNQYHHEFSEKHADWTKNTDVMPIIRMITVLDPRFVEAYLYGAWILGPGCGRYPEAEGFLREGIRNNLDDSELHIELAIIYARHMNRPRLALVEAHQALKLAKGPFYRHRAALLCAATERMLNRQPAPRSATD